MKLKTIIIGAVAAVLGLSGCQKNPTEDGLPFIKVNDQTALDITFEAKASTKAVTVKANRAWKVGEIKEEWIETNVSGNQKECPGGAQMEITVKSNDAADAFNRTATITLVASNKTATITVTQQGAKGDNTPILDCDFKAAGQGSFTIEDKTQPVAGTSAWAYDSKYGMKATGYVDGKNYASESWLISPVVDLSKETEACLTFRHAANYFSDVKKEVSVKIRPEGGEWKDATIQIYPSSFTFVDSGDIDLTEYAGKKMQFAFVYTSTASKAGTWEVDKVKIERRAGANVEAQKVASVAELLALDASTKAVIENVTVVETYAQGYVITDRTDYANVFLGAAPAVKVGDVLKVEGLIETYYNCKQLSGVTVQTLSSGAEVKIPQPKDITADFNTYISDKIEYVSFTGTLAVSGNYFNINVDGATAKTGSLVYPANADELKTLDGQNLIFEGWYLYSTGSGNKYTSIVAHEVRPAAGFLSVSPKSVNVDAAATSTVLSVKSDLAWTVVSKSEGLTLSAESGNGNAEVTVSFAANTEFKSRKYSVVFGADGKENVEVSINQGAAVDPDAKFVELTNDEIVAALKANNSTSTSYVETPFTYTSASGNWTAIAVVNMNNPYIQIRNTLGSYLLTPEFDKNIDKIELVANTSTSNVQNRKVYAVPVDVDLTTKNKDDKYNSEGHEAITATNYGMTAFECNAGGTHTITISGDVKQVKLIAYDGAVYISSVKVYFK